MLLYLKVIHIPIIAPNVTNVYNNTDGMSIGGAYYQKQGVVYLSLNTKIKENRA